MEFTVFQCLLLLSVIILCNARCQSIYGQGLTDNDKRIIVNKHNELRRLIAAGKVPGQPRGINFKTIKYDENLAREAQRISNTCEFAHKKVSDGRWHAVGQNLYTTMSTAPSKGADWSGAIQSWFDEHKFYRYGSGFSPSTGHYTQIVWADTEYVGCGFTYYADGGQFKYKKLYTCNYGPAGNYVGQKPYRTR